MTTDYEPVLSRAVMGLSPNTRETRQAIYDRARRALGHELRTTMPPLSTARMREERAALEEAIKRIELRAERGLAVPRPPERREPVPVPPAGYPPPSIEPPPLPEVIRPPAQPRPTATPLRTVVALENPQDPEAETLPPYAREAPAPPRRPGKRWRGLALGVAALALVGGGVAFVYTLGAFGPAKRPAQTVATVAPAAAVAPTLPQTYGVFALQKGRTVELPRNAARANLTPLLRLPSIRLEAGPVTFIIYDKSVQSVVPHAALNQLARVDTIYRVDGNGNTVGASDLEPVEWVYRESGTNLKPAPVAGKPEMVQYHATVAPGGYAVKVGNLSFEFVVDGKSPDPNHCLDKYEVAAAQTPTQYRPCSARTVQPTLDLFMRGQAWAARGDLKRAIGRFDDALRTNAKYLPALGMRAYLAVMTNNIDGAIADSTAAIDLVLSSTGDNPWATHEAISSIYGIRGLAFYRKNELGRAAADLNESVRFNPRNSAAFEVRARVRLLSSDAKGALTDADQFVNLAPSYGAFQLRGEIYKRLGRREEAIADFRRALSAQVPDQARREIVAQLQELSATP